MYNIARLGTLFVIDTFINTMMMKWEDDDDGGMTT